MKKFNDVEPIEMDVRKLPIMKSCCKSCPFKLDKNGNYQNQELVDSVTMRTLFKAQQLCHGTETYEKNKRVPHNRCYGSFNHNAKIYERMGLDPEKLK